MKMTYEEYMNKVESKSSTTERSSIKKSNKSVWVSKRGLRNFYRMENQDYVLIDQKENERIYGIFDGHGKYGTMIS